jgi:quinoprotein glucose dehydrogenase
MNCRNFTFPLFSIALLSISCTENKYRDWKVTGGSKENIRYSTLTQIDTTNVQQLKVAWQYRTGDADTVHSSQIQCNPIIVNGVLYGTSPQLKLMALDAKTGKAKWRFDPQAEKENVNATARFILNNNRGVTYWNKENDQRVFFTAGAILWAIDAVTGKPILSFGDSGKVDLHHNLGRDVSKMYVAATSPGIIFNDLLIMGSRVHEGSEAALGHIRAYDVRTGKMKWIFHTIPQPGEFGFDSWKDTTAYKYIGGANAWSGFSLDEKRGIVYASTGSASFDFYGGKRLGNNLFANSILALDAATGKYKWHYQTVHHDVWDRDLPTPASLITIEKEGKKIDAVAQPTKHGFVFVLNRETGEPVYPIEERPVPTNTELEGEELSPTQPYPTWPVPFMRQSISESDLNRLLPDSSRQQIELVFSKVDKGHMFTPPSLRGSIFFPGLDGGAEWGGASYDPETHYLYVNANEMPWNIQMVEVEKRLTKEESYLHAGKQLYTSYCMACHAANRKGSGNNPSLIDIEKKYNTKDFEALIRSGRRMMPAFQNLSSQEVDAIASFVFNDKSLQQKKLLQKADTNSFTHLLYNINGYNKFLSPEGYAGIQPPWGTLNAISLKTGKIVWKIPFGEFPELKGKGVTGTENYGGSVVTKSGLLFIAATSDGKIRAFNKKSGKLLWEYTLPVPAFATPSVYEVDGKEFLVIACGGGKMKTKSGDYYIAFGLP